MRSVQCAFFQVHTYLHCLFDLEHHGYDVALQPGFSGGVKQWHDGAVDRDQSIYPCSMCTELQRATALTAVFPAMAAEWCACVHGKAAPASVTRPLSCSHSRRSLSSYDSRMAGGGCGSVEGDE